MIVQHMAIIFVEAHQVFDLGEKLLLIHTILDDEGVHQTNRLFCLMLHLSDLVY
jgi:Tfp pilus assembly protein PilZ